jgi:hypothetical protein
VDQIRVDTTVVTELEYLNILPDTSKIGGFGLDESSFLKGMNNMTDPYALTPKSRPNIVGGISSQVDVENTERIKELEQ